MTPHPSIELCVDPDHFFRITEIKRFTDGSGFVGNTSLKSGAFALHNHKFYFDDLENFLLDVRRIYDSLSGTAQLRTPYERNHLLLTAASRGHISVVGHFEYFSGESQKLDFSFTTDQTFLPDFIRTLEQACREIYAKG